MDETVADALGRAMREEYVRQLGDVAEFAKLDFANWDETPEDVRALDRAAAVAVVRAFLNLQGQPVDGVADEATA